MENTYKYLSEYSKRINLKIKSCNLYDPNIRETSDKGISSKEGKLKVNINAFPSFISIWIKNITTELAFSINKPDKIMAFDTRLIAPLLRYPIYYDDIFMSTNEINLWFSNPEVLNRIQILNLGDDESLHIYKNAICIYLKEKRDINDTIQILLLLINLLPSEKNSLSNDEIIVDDLIFNPNKLPEKFQTLSRYIVKWSVSDDNERNEIIENMTDNEKKILVKALHPIMNDIKYYLESFKDVTIPNEAILLGNLAELVSEL